MKLTTAGLWILLALSGCAKPAADPPPVIDVPAAPSTEDVTEKLNWPRTINDGANSIVIYQPQVQSWADNQIAAQAAVAVTRAEVNKPSYGVIWVTARTEIDKTNRLAELNDRLVTAAVFPDDHAHEKEYQAAIQKDVDDNVSVISLDHLEANLSVVEAEQKGNAVPVKNDPPRIIVSRTLALLVLIDGQPALRPVEGMNLLRVINTRALILLDPRAKRYYLHAMNGWLMSESITGQWAQTLTPPAGADEAKDQLAKEKTIDLLDPADADSAPKTPPTIVISTTPAELVQLRGEPEYTPIQGTGLLYVKNTDSALFMFLTSQQHYLLVSGRWFTSASIDGPWTFVSGKDLPAEFAKIPADSPKANVLASVPGTDQAREAIVANSIPQTATVNIADAHLTVAYDGAPRFAAVDGAQGLSYALNTPSPVIAVAGDGTYWCVQNGIWFHAAAATGPWIVATSVPGIIYTIPASCPIHYVTYVKVYGYTPTVVYVGYTSGYMGTCISTDGVVVYGTGYYYPAYVETVWVGYPTTYGYGASFACGAATGFAFGFAAGAILGDCWCHPYWGPCWGYGHVDINSSSVYSNWHGGVTYSNRHYSYNGATGESWSSGGARTFNPYSGRSSAGGYSGYFNRDTGDFNAARGGATYNPNTGIVRAGGASIHGNAYDGNASVNGGRAVYDTRTKTGLASYDNNVYAGHDGNVYKYNKDSGWQQHTDNGWQTPVESDQSFKSQQSNLDQQRSSRDLGQQHFQNLGGSTGSGGRSSGFSARRGRR
jgi:hypothetical protein